MDRYNSPQCKAIEDAIDAMNIPCHVEVKDGSLSITILGTSPVTLDRSNGGTTVKVMPTPEWVNLGEGVD